MFLNSQNNMLMQSIARNSYYELKYDENKNRLYFKIIGFWPSVDAVPSYFKDIDKAASVVKPGFTMVSDIRQMKTPPQEVGKAHEQAQQKMVNAGLKKTAEIVTSAILKMTTRRYSQSSNMNREAFSSLDEAEKWLDE